MSLNKSEHENHRIPQDAQIAQLVEQRTENPRVTGSIPVLGIFFLPKFFKHLIIIIYIKHPLFNRIFVIKGMDIYVK